MSGSYLWSSSRGCGRSEDEPLRDAGRTKDADVVVVNSKKEENKRTERLTYLGKLKLQVVVWS